MAFKMAAENRKFNISDYMAYKTEIPSKCSAYILWSRNAIETKPITICCPITKFAEMFKMGSKMAAENRKFNISDSMADKTEIPRAKHTFLWSRNAMETKLITICCLVTKFPELFKMTFNMADEYRKFNISNSKFH